jgi:alkyl hydroperoxide reductase subunit AhpC
MQYSVIHNTGIGRSTEETLRVLDALQSGGVCPANWKKGDKNL